MGYGPIYGSQAWARSAFSLASSAATLQICRVLRQAGEDEGVGGAGPEEVLVGELLMRKEVVRRLDEMSLAARNVINSDRLRHLDLTKYRARL